MPCKIHKLAVEDRLGLSSGHDTFEIVIVTPVGHAPDLPKRLQVPPPPEKTPWTDPDKSARTGNGCRRGSTQSYEPSRTETGTASSRPGPPRRAETPVQVVSALLCKFPVGSVRVERQLLICFPHRVCSPMQLHLQRDESQKPITACLSGQDLHGTRPSPVFLGEPLDEVGR